MNFCPLCYKMLLIESTVSGNRLVCKICRYFYPLTFQFKKIITFNQDDNKLQIIEQGQETKNLPITQARCNECNCTRAYFQQRQTRSADQASTIFYTCVQCNYKWNQN